MRETSTLYKSLRTAIGSYYEVKLIRGNRTYGMSELKSISIACGLYDGDGPQIGSTKSAECKVKLIEKSANWPRMASFEIRVRLSSADGTQKSEWLSMGTYYTDERSESKYGDLSIVAYDGMLLNEQSWTDKIDEQDLPTTWPITGRAALNLLIGANLIVVDNLTDIDDTVPFVGIDTTSTVRDILSLVAAGNGYNCQLTASGHIRFVGMATGGSGAPAIAGIAIAGVSVVGTDEESTDYGADVGKTRLGFNIASLDFSPPLDPISGVELTTALGTTARAGNNTGYVVKADCQFSDSLIAPICLANLSGLQYAPFRGNKAFTLDPAAEVGDLVQIGADCYQMVTIDWKLGKHITANISAPYEEEVDHEYTMENESAKTLRKALQAQEQLEERVYSSIQQSADQIMTQVGENYATQASVDGQIGEVEQHIVTVQTTVTQTVDALELEVQGITEDYDELRMHYRFDADGETIGKTNSSKSMKLSNDGIDMMVNNESVTHWNQDEMVAPRKVNIPIGGSLQLGNFLWQPRSSGNMSLLWVGD